MLSWAFRNRVRLAEIYGCAEPPPLAGARFAGGAGGSIAARTILERRPGSLRRTRAALEVRPMPIRAGELERRR